MVSSVVENTVSFATKYDVVGGLCQPWRHAFTLPPGTRLSVRPRREPECAVTRPVLPGVRREGFYFFVRLLDDVILLVVIRSPMYFCRNLLLLSSLSCSSRTASMRLNMVTRDS